MEMQKENPPLVNVTCFFFITSCPFCTQSPAQCRKHVTQQILTQGPSICKRGTHSKCMTL
jgi:hypothetical protein